MGQAKRRRSSDLNYGKKPEMIMVGFGGLCGSCDEVHPIEPYPYGYTVGLTERGGPELIIVGNSANPLAEIKKRMAADGVDPDPDLEECFGNDLMEVFMQKLD